jgi:hypothetical protein
VALTVDAGHRDVGFVDTVAGSFGHSRRHRGRSHSVSQRKHGFPTGVAVRASALVSAGVSLLALTAILGVAAGEVAAASAAAGQALQIGSVAAQAMTPAAAAQVRVAAVHYLTRTAASEVAASPAASRIAAAAAAVMVLTAGRSSQAAGFHLTGVEDPLLCVPESQMLPRLPVGSRPYWGMALPFHGATNLIGRVVR